MDNCTLLLNNPYRDFKVDDVTAQLQKPDTKSKITAMTKIISAELNGEPQPQLLMYVIRFVMTSDDHQIKRLVLMYLEIINRTENGSLRPELIMIVDRLSKDLEHPNEYIRGLTLKFLCRINEKEILQPLVPSVIENMTHKHVYVRKATAHCIGHIYQVDKTLLESAGDVLRTALKAEKDSMTRVVIFSVLTRYLPVVAVKFLISISQQITTFSEAFIMAVLKFVRLVYKSTPQYKSKYVEILGVLILSNSMMIKLESASIFPLISGNAHVVRKSIETLVDVVCNSSDINVKLLGIQRVKIITVKHKKIIKANCVSDLLRMLPIASIRKDVLKLVMNVLAPRNADEIAIALKKEVGREDIEFVREVLRALKTCKEVNESVEIDDVMFESLTHAELSKEVVGYIENKLMEKENGFMVNRLVDLVDQINDSKTLRNIIWMICEYSQENKDVIDLFRKHILSVDYKKVIEEKQKKENENEEEVDDEDGMPDVQAKKKEEFAEFFTSDETIPSAVKEKNQLNQMKEMKKKTVVLEDGTYGTVIEEEKKETQPIFEVTGIKKMIKEMDSMVISTLANGLTKLCWNVQGKEGNVLRAKALQILIEILKIEKETQKTLTSDCKERIHIAMMILSSAQNEAIMKQYKSIEELEKSIQKEIRKQTEVKFTTNEIVSVDEKIKYELLTLQEDEEEFEDAQSRLEQLKGEKKIEKLNNIVQLTGYSDPFYIEAIVNVTHFDITLDCLVINQTPSTLQNITIELIPHGGMKIKTKPAPVTLGPGDFVRLALGVTVDSTVVGVISGYVNYDIADKNVTYTALDANLILNELRIEYLDQMTPCDIDIEVYQKKWMEYEWENKIPIDTEYTDLKEFALMLSSIAKLKCITPTVMFCDGIGFLSANYYAKNIFDEDALINLSAEKVGQKITGWIRIRSKTQSLAINLGDKIQANQKKGGNK